MKRMLFSWLLVISLACDKSHFEITSEIIGNWELRRSEGGIAGTIEFAPGNGNIYTFEANGNFSYRSNGAIADKGTFTINHSSSPGQWTLRLTSQMNNGAASLLIKLDKNDLVFLPTETCCDMPTLTYSRI